jgi:DNA-binding NtrC family response regulator
MVNEKAFREDLLYRLRTFEVRLPPLRERPEDTSMLAHRFLAEIGADDPGIAVGLDRALAERTGHPWPGNVRELRSFVRRFAALGDAGLGGPLPRDEGAPRARVDLPWKEAKAEWVDALERAYFASLLAETGGNLSKAARRADIDRNHLANIAARHGLRRG